MLDDLMVRGNSSEFYPRREKRLKSWFGFEMPEAFALHMEEGEGDPSDEIPFPAWTNILKMRRSAQQKERICSDLSSLVRSVQLRTKVELAYGEQFLGSGLLVAEKKPWSRNEYPFSLT